VALQPALQSVSLCVALVFTTHLPTVWLQAYICIGVQSESWMRGCSCPLGTPDTYLWQ
jgi:hypothetical protein